MDRDGRKLGIALGASILASCTGGATSVAVGEDDAPFVAVCAEGDGSLDERWQVASEGGVDALAISGDTAAIAGADGSVRVWSLGDEGAELAGLLPFEDSSGYSAAGCQLAFGDDGRRLAVAHFGIVELWSIPENRRLSVLRLGSTWVSAVAVSDDGAVVAIADASQSVHLWTPETGALVVLDQSLATAGLAFVGGSHDLVVAGTVLPGGWGATPVLQRFEADESWATAAQWGCGDVRRMAVAPDGHTAFSVGLGWISRVDLDEPESEAVVAPAPWLTPEAIAVSSDAAVVAAVGSEGTLRLWSADGLEEIARRDVALQIGLSFDSSGERLHALGRDGVLRAFGCAE